MCDIQFRARKRFFKVSQDFVISTNFLKNINENIIKCLSWSPSFFLEILQSQANQLKQSKENIIDIPGTIVEYRNIESGEHIKRVKQYTKILADQIMKQFPEYNLNEKQIR
ncbi:MAG: hypothetical protein ACI4LR_03970 [Treponema sp.]